MRTTDLTDLTATVEKVRSEMHPDLDEKFVFEVIAAEERNPEDDQQALREIQVALKAALAEKGMI